MERQSRNSTPPLGGRRSGKAELDRERRESSRWQYDASDKVVRSHQGWQYGASDLDLAATQAGGVWKLETGCYTSRKAGSGCYISRRCLEAGTGCYTSRRCLEAGTGCYISRRCLEAGTGAPTIAAYSRRRLTGLGLVWGSRERTALPSRVWSGGGIAAGC